MAANVRRQVCKDSDPGQEYIPPTPGTPATETTVNKDFNLGWTGRARSLVSLSAGRSAYARFKAKRSTAGIFIGLSQQHSDIGYFDIRFGVFLRNGWYKLVHNGVATGTSQPYNQDSEFQLLLTDGFFRLSVIGDIHDSSDIHEVGDPSMFTQQFVLSACIYAGGDFVYSPAFRAASQGGALLKALEAIGGEGTYAMGDAQFESLTAWGIEAGFPTTIDFSPTGPFNYAIQTLEVLSAVGSDYAYAHGHTVLPEFDIIGYSGLLEVPFAHSRNSLAPLSGYATGLTGEIGGGTATLNNLEALSSEGSYGHSINTLLPLFSYAHAYEGNTDGFVYGFAHALSPLTGPAEILVTMNAAGEITGAFIGQIVFSGDLSASVTASASLTSSNVLNALLDAVANISDSTVTRSLLDHDIWVMNRNTGAFTRYEQWNFLATAVLNGTPYGVRSDGIYRLTGSDDDGEDIEASVDFGEYDFNTTALKRIDACYAGLSSDGDMYLRVNANGETYTYAVRNVDEILRTQRFDIGRGMKASFFAFELVNSEGSDFELDGIEFVAVPLTRRIR
jgi:hypothetical protein